MKNFSSLLFLCLIFLAVSCKEDPLTTDDPIDTEVEIRIENKSDFKFENLMVKIRGNDTMHGTLDAGEKTDYVLYEAAYAYAYLECEINDELFVIQPIDFVGESFLEPGKYTYIIEASSTIIEKYGRLSLTLRAD